MIETPLQNQELKLIHPCPLVIFLEHLPGAWHGFRDLEHLPLKVRTICTLSKTNMCYKLLSSSFLENGFL